MVVAGLYALEVGGKPRVAPLCLEEVEISGHGVFFEWRPCGLCLGRCISRRLALSSAVLDSNATLELKTSFSVDEAISQSAYFFPLNSDVAIYGLRATISSGGSSRVIAGKVLKKEAARKAFSKAVDEGRPAALLERSEASEEVYKLALGALPAGSSVVVEVSFAQTLRADASSPGALRLLLPAALLHRYIPAATTARLGGSGADVAEAVASTVDAIAGRGDVAGGPDHPSLRLRLALAAATPVVSAESPSHGEYLHRARTAAAGISSIEITVPKSQVGRERMGGRSSAAPQPPPSAPSAVAQPCGLCRPERRRQRDARPGRPLCPRRLPLG